MKRLLFGFAVITVFLTTVAAQEHGAAAPPGRPPAKWITYTSAEGRYTVSMTGQPKLSSQPITAASGDNLIQHVASVSADPAYLMVGYFDYPASVTFSLDAARDSMVNSLQGTLIDESSISVGGAPGRAIKIAAKTEAGVEVINRAHFYDIESRIYILQCLIPAANDGPGAIQICDRFFDSFRVKNSPN
jgi:hypothetical protein